MKIITKKTNETTVVSSRTPGAFDQSRGGEEMKTDRQTHRQTDRSDGTGWTEHSDGEMAGPGGDQCIYYTDLSTEVGCGIQLKKEARFMVYS